MDFLHHGDCGHPPTSIDLRAFTDAIGSIFPEHTPIILERSYLHYYSRMDGAKTCIPAALVVVYLSIRDGMFNAVGIAPPDRRENMVVKGCELLYDCGIKVACELFGESIVIEGTTIAIADMYGEYAVADALEHSAPAMTAELCRLQGQHISKWLTAAHSMMQFWRQNEGGFPVNLVIRPQDPQNN